jgi:putative DNA primase/helicase
LARTQIRVPVDAFDAHPDHLNTPTGIVDLRTGDLRPHDPTEYHTKVTHAHYLGADHADPRWDAALASIPDDVRDWVQVFMGQACTGYPNTEDRLLLLDGDGQNGKGVLTNDGALQALGDYGVLLNETILVGNVSHPVEKMALRGARMTLIDETPEARRLDTQRLKKILGQPKMTARELYRKEVTFDLTHTLVVATNYTPTVTESDRGTWRRLLRLRMPYTYKGGDAPLTGDNDRRAIPDIKAALSHDGDVQAACLTWLVQGAVKWYAAGRQQEATAARIDADTRSWRGEGDLLMNYVEDHLILGQGGHVAGSELLEHFNQWLEAQGNRRWSMRVLLSRILAHEEFRLANVTHKDRHRAGVDVPSRAPHRAGLPGAQGLPTQYTALWNVTYRRMT